MQFTGQSTFTPFMNIKDIGTVLYVTEELYHFDSHNVLDTKMD